MATSVLIHFRDFETLAYSWMKRARSDGVLHAEVFFDPQAHTSRGVPVEVVVEGLEAGLGKGEKDFGMSAKLIMCIEKHRTVENCVQTVRDIGKYVKQGLVIGLGMDSSEEGNPPEKYAPAYDLAKELGYPHTTAHVGEEGPASSVRTAVIEMGIERVDHGTKAAEDSELLVELAKRKIFFTLCPLSNVDLKVIPDVSKTPILTFMEAGIKFSINSDDPSYFSSLIDNYFALQEAFNFTKNTWGKLMKDSIEGSWCSRERKDELLNCLDKVLAENDL